MDFVIGQLSFLPTFFMDCWGFISAKVTTLSSWTALLLGFVLARIINFQTLGSALAISLRTVWIAVGIAILAILLTIIITGHLPELDFITSA